MMMPDRPARPIRLHFHALSGHAHRAQLFLSLLGLPFEIVPVDLRAGEQKAPSFLALNPFGQVPVIEDGEAVVADSNAILVYLAARYDASGRWAPRDPVLAARVQVWLSAAAGPLAAGPGAARRAAVFRTPTDEGPRKIAAGLFSVMEGQLAARPFLVGDGPTIADVAMYTYTAHAPEGGISLEPYEGVRAWLARIEALPGFVPMRPFAA